MAGSLILVDDSLISDRIDGTNGCPERSLCIGFVAGTDSLSHMLDRGAQLGAQTGVVVTLSDVCLARFLACALLAMKIPELTAAKIL